MSRETQGKRQPSPRVQRKHAQARQEILEVAQDILHEHGIDSVTLASVAGRLGMTKQALYHYFPSKEGLVRNLVTTLIENETNALIVAIEESDAVENTLGTLIHAFYDHYISRLNAFRAVYCQSQLYTTPTLDKDTIRTEVNPRTRHLFDVLEERMARGSMSRPERERVRKLAFTAWLSALGLLTMLGVADALDDSLLHSDRDLLRCLSTVFEAAAPY